MGIYKGMVLTHIINKTKVKVKEFNDNYLWIIADQPINNKFELQLNLNSFGKWLFFNSDDIDLDCEELRYDARYLQYGVEEVKLCLESHQESLTLKRRQSNSSKIKLKILDFDCNKSIYYNKNRLFYDETNELFFDDFYVPFSHNTSKQVSLAIGHSIIEFSDNIHNFRYETSYKYQLDLIAYNLLIENIRKDLASKKNVLFIDMAGLFVENLDWIDRSNKNLYFNDAKSLQSGNVIQKNTDRKTSDYFSNKKRQVINEKYNINPSTKSESLPIFDIAYIVDDVYTTGDTVRRVKELIHELNPEIGLIQTYCIARTARYEINDFRYSKTMDNGKKNVLFVGESNKGRSVLAEAIAKNYNQDLTKKYNIFSVGIKRWAGRQICDMILDYLIDNGLNSEELVSQRLNRNDNQIVNKINKDNWRIIVLDEELLNWRTEQYLFNQVNVKFYQIDDVSKWGSPNYGNVEKIAQQLKEIIKKELVDIE